MNDVHSKNGFNPSISRRKFVKGIAAGGVVASIPMSINAKEELPQKVYSSVLSGTVIDLVVEEVVVNFTGSTRIATVVNRSIPAPTLRLKEGDEVTLRVTNKLSEPTSIHWHGIILPFEMDGVPGISFNGIKPGETFTYKFTLEQSGTYWYHSHSGSQEQTGMYGALIIEPKEGEIISADKDYVVLLSDWTDEHPMRILSKLKSQSDYYNFNQPTAIDFINDVSNSGLKVAFTKRQMWNEMRMNSTDLADLSSATLTYLMNGTTPNGNWTGVFNKGEKIRLRFINGAGGSFYDVRIPGIKMTVVQTDGVDIEPIDVDEFRFGPGETYDVIVQPIDNAHTIFAQSMDRTGFARGTLSTAIGLSAPIPTVDKPEPLSMEDMMGSMDGMDHGSMAGMDHGSMPGMASGAMPAMDHSSMAGMDHGSMPGMASGAMPAMDHSSMAGMDHGSMPGMASGAMPTMDHSSMAGMDHGSMAGMSNATPPSKVRHASTEFGPSVDARVDTPRRNLNDPGVGLRNNGRRVLTLADLKTKGGPIDPRPAEREIELHLTGNMERYTWSFDGVEFGKSTPIHFNYGERVRITLHNDTMMTHPMHLHGMWSELENEDGSFLARKHTIPVQPAQRISFLVTADAIGRWAWHCHIMFHMDAGMFREVVVS
ncbi:copper resistance protein A [Aeromonas caviae]|uniref:Copper resistance protein A n=1 Tax=Aeromonas caviae TaxID=648 RepID=A0AA37D1J3_AERCA|nr:copper resistance system multicopper oxidase [Aeromonas caviae]GJA21191.1 copper resistance protein A [Aeromonas caviae]GJA30054.1 copper resistance protein A [Aeromonas caviae]GJA65875.1 copper resistance protein A [Aeromonas caviae]